MQHRFVVCICAHALDVQSATGEQSSTGLHVNTGHAAVLVHKAGFRFTQPLMVKQFVSGLGNLLPASQHDIMLDIPNGSRNHMFVLCGTIYRPVYPRAILTTSHT